MSHAGYEYEGDELALFQHAINWKAYFTRQIAPYLRGDVAEVGAGLGTTTVHLVDGQQRSWLCIEPDAAMADQLRARVPPRLAGVDISVTTGTLTDLPAGQLFDTIIYIDVLEHIEHDRAEVATAASRLRPGGHLVVLAPAHQWLYSPFDRRIGHHRRYSAASLTALTPTTLAVTRVWYLDCVGLLASGANRFLLGQSMPTQAQIETWDRWMVAASRVLDPIIGRRLGKSVVAVWTRLP
jgi:2-polyprenyl-3-methyl-5-hydroxy-6-metoxy-1,4-benzoquinol methylase